MKQEVKARVQYGDLHGEVACDGHDGPFLHKLAREAGISDEYFPIAVSVYVGESGTPYIHLFACDRSQYGDNIESIKRKGVSDGEVEVRKFDVAINVKKLFRLIKRLDVFAKNRGIAEIPIVTHDPL